MFYNAMIGQSEDLLSRRLLVNWMPHIFVLPSAAPYQVAAPSYHLTKPTLQLECRKTTKPLNKSVENHQTARV